MPVRVERPVRQGTGGDVSRYAASIEAYDITPLSFRVGGYLVSLAQRRGIDGRWRDLQDGDRVSRGEVLAKLRVTEFDAQLAQVRSRVAEAEVGLTKARQDRDRAQRLFDQRSLTKPELEGAFAAYDVAVARVATARAGLTEAETAHGDTTLRSPADGVVLARRPSPGTLVGPGVEVVRIGQVRHVRAMFGVPDTALPQLPVGRELTVEIGAVGARVTGAVSAVAGAADPLSRSYTVEVRLDNPDARLSPGMIATVEVPGPGAATAGASILVPISAVVRAPGPEGGFAVFVADGADRADARAVARVRRVSLGDVAGNRIAVVDGVPSDARIIVTGASLVHDGDAVRIVR